MRTVLHLARTTPPPEVIGDRDWVVDLRTMQLADRGSPPVPPGPITDAQLVQLIFAAELAVTW